MSSQFSFTGTFSIYAEPSCNFSCQHCAVFPRISRRERMDGEDARLIAERLVEFEREKEVDSILYLGNAIKVVLTGGEARLNPHLPEIVQEFKKAESRFKKRRLAIEINTNGFGFVGEDEMEKELTRLSKLGILTVYISDDNEHRKVAGNLVSYSAVGEAQNIQRNLWRDPYIGYLDVGNFVVPIGRARDLPEDRLFFKGNMEEMRAKIENEYMDWHISPKAHCYCDLADLFTAPQRAGKSSVSTLHPVISKSAGKVGVEPCFILMFPTFGNLSESGILETYRQVRETEPYRTIGMEGPQGLARQRGLPEEEIRERFLKRTPCGLCEDLNCYGYGLPGNPVN
jgi:hypothetical protein